MIKQIIFIFNMKDKKDDEDDKNDELKICTYCKHKKLKNNYKIKNNGKLFKTCNDCLNKIKNRYNDMRKIYSNNIKTNDKPNYIVDFD